MNDQSEPLGAPVLRDVPADPDVLARDGYPLPAPFRCDTLNVAPGERWDAIVLADAHGSWAFHCHILGHAEGQTGMFGMATERTVSA